MISNRKFGVEIECIGMSQVDIANLLQNHGINAGVEEYNHTLRDYWKITYDSSVIDNSNPSGRGAEVVSPPLSGEAGIAEVIHVAKILSEAGVDVNNTCGLHIHVDACDLAATDLASIFLRYAYFEQTIDRFMAPNRRENANQYCLSTRSIVENIRSSVMRNYGEMTVQDFISRIPRGRYYKVNIQAFLRHGTVEFRQHHGTINSKKIENWIRFCVNFVETSKVSNELEITREDRQVPIPLLVNDTLDSRVFNTLPIEVRFRRGGWRTRQLIAAFIEVGSAGLPNDIISNIMNCMPSSVSRTICTLREEGLTIQRDRRHRTYVLTMLPNGVLPETLRNGQARQQYRTETVITGSNIGALLENSTRNRDWSSGLESEIRSFYEERAIE